MGGTSSYISLLRLTGFLGCVWFGSKASKLIGISSIVFEIIVGIVLGPNVLAFVPTEYSVCRARQTSCDAPPDLLLRLWNNEVIIEDGLRTIYNRGLCPKEDYRFQFDQDTELVDELLANATITEPNMENGDAEIGGGRRLSGGGSYPTIEACLIKSCKNMVSRECLLSPSFLTIFGQAGVALMIFESGMKFDFSRAKRVAPNAIVVAVLGVALPLIGGALLTMAFGKPFVPDGVAVGTSLSPTSIGCSVKLLTEAGVVQEDFGQATITAAFLVDIMALIMLNVVFSLHGDEFDVMATVVKPIIGIAFMAFAVVLAVKVWPRVMNDWILSRVPETDAKWNRKDQVLLLMMTCILVLYASITYLLGTHLWGCFTAGISFTCLSKNNHPHKVWVGQTKRITKWMLRIFFASAVAFSIPIQKLLSIDAFWKGTLLGLGPCILGKFFCAPNMGGARFVVGSAMTTRAEFAYLIAQMALSADVMGPDTYSVVIWALLYATMFAPLLFRKLLTRYMAQYRAASSDLEGGTEALPADAFAACEVKAAVDVHVDGRTAANEVQDARHVEVVAGEVALTGEAVADAHNGGRGESTLI